MELIVESESQDLGWWRFRDSHSGGTRKTAFETIYIFGTKYEAEELFKKHVYFDPNHVTCDCCGSAFDVDWKPSKTLKDAAQWIRGDEEFKDYFLRDDVLIILQKPRSLKDYLKD